MQATSFSERTVELSKVPGEFRFVGGLAWSRSGYLVAADTHERMLLRVESRPRPSVIRDKDGGVAGMAFDIQGRLYLCEADARRVSRMDRQGNVERFFDGFEGKKFNSPNEITVRRDGNVYFTDPAFGSAADTRELDFNGVFHATPRGELAAVARWKTRPNGIALSPDGRLLYVADSDRHTVAVFELDRNGSVSNQKEFAIHVNGVPGGLCVDSTGRVYVCAKGISVYSPQGKFERQLVSDRTVTTCTFGEPEGDTLYIATRGDIFAAKFGVKGAFQY